LFGSFVIIFGASFFCEAGPASRVSSSQSSGFMTQKREFSFSRHNMWDLDNHNLCRWDDQQDGLHDKVAFSPIGDVFATFGSY
jgi:hypothetical protein